MARKQVGTTKGDDAKTTASAGQHHQHHQVSVDNAKEPTIKELERARLAKQHAWPLLGYGLAALAVATWWWVMPVDAKLRSIFNAAVFSVIEFTFYTMTVEMPNGDILLRPFDSRCRKGHTTIHQFACNVLYTPLLMDVYFSLVPSWPARILLFPINIWLLEVVQGYSLIYLHGYNPAWTYYGNDTYFTGNIKLAYWPFWLMLGAVVELGYPLEVIGSQWLAGFFV